MTKVVAWNDLEQSDLVVDAVYESGPDGIAGEPISKVLAGSGNMGGFRAAGVGPVKNWVVLFTTGEDRDWPDALDISTGRFDYYGDNRHPGNELHETGPGGNRVLRNAFADLHDEKNPRSGASPFFVFRKHPLPNRKRSVQFKGLAVAGYPGLPATEDLVAVWKSTQGQRFQNYRAAFTILNVPVVSRAWLSDLAKRDSLSANAPAPWRVWKENGRYLPLIAEPTTSIRTIEQQTPDTRLKRDVVRLVWSHFKDSPTAFEAFAARVFQMTDARVVVDEITRGVVDGGRDAAGRYLLGLPADPVYAEFSLEAKCYRPPIDGHSPTTVGVKDVSRLISRLRHRQFGVLVTTSVVARQAYEEVREDRHPIVFLSGRDIAEVLIRNGYNTEEKIALLLESDYLRPGQ